LFSEKHLLRDRDLFSRNVIILRIQQALVIPAMGWYLDYNYANGEVIRYYSNRGFDLKENITRARYSILWHYTVQIETVIQWHSLVLQSTYLSRYLKKILHHNNLYRWTIRRYIIISLSLHTLHCLDEQDLLLHFRNWFCLRFKLEANDYVFHGEYNIKSVLINVAYADEVSNICKRNKHKTYLERLVKKKKILLHVFLIRCPKETLALQCCNICTNLQNHNMWNAGIS
jgi:hypothetical protein